MVYHPSHIIYGDWAKLCQLCGACSCCDFDMLIIPCRNSKETKMTLETTLAPSTIPDRIEAEYYRMNPKTDDILSEGVLLKNGMIVLIEDSLLRETKDLALQIDEATGEIKNQRSYNRLLTTNRWCRVSNLKVNGQRERYYSTASVSFIAEYADGTKEKRRYGADYAWLVKLDSLTQPN